MDLHLQDLMNIASGIFSTDDWVRLVIIAVVIIAGGFFMQGFAHLLNTTVLALLIVWVALFVRTMMDPGAGDVTAEFQKQYDAFLAMDVKTLLAWFLSFAILIAIVHGIRSLVMRG